MIKGKSFLAVIPARGGSKRLPGKNMLNFRGSPLIVQTIISARKSMYIDALVVTSDSDDIIKIAQKSNVSYSIKRPDYLSTDKATTVDVVLHAEEILSRAEGKKFDFIILLQPTSPLRNYVEIDKSIEMLMKKKADGIISVTEVDHPLEWCNTLPSDNSLNNFISENYLRMQSQDFPKRYRVNGAIYISEINKLKQKKSFFIDNSYAYIMDRNLSVDIDEDIDFILAESLSIKNEIN